jgi:magnesium-transporting ATPase (P-type)
MIEVPIKYEERAGESKLSVVRDGLRFLFSILGTAAVYNPVRILGALSLVAVVLAVLALLPWVMALNSGVENRSAYANLLFIAMTLAIVAVNLFSTGTVFNYIVSLFHRRPIRQGLFGRPVFRRPLEQRFGTIGVLLFIVGVVLFLMALVLPGRDEPAWFLLVPSAMFVMTGIQLGTSWLLVHLLTELSKRDLKVEADLGTNINPLEDETVILPVGDTALV